MKRPKKVDSLIVGGGLIGLKLLKELESQGKKVLLVEKTNDIGGSTSTFDNEQKSIRLNSLLWSTEEEANFETYTLGKKGITPFLGFGDYKGSALEIAEFFISSSSKIMKTINIDMTGDEPIKTLTQVTSMIEQDDAKLCELNGKDLIQYQELYWCAPMEELLKVTPKDKFIDLKQKASKAKRFDGMTIQFEGDLDQFKDHQDSKLILFGEDHTPWMGAVIEDQVLTFTTFYSYTLSQDHDFIRRHLKSLKRQLRKIFPDLYSEDQINTFSTDRLTLHTSVASQLNLTTKAQKELLPVVFFGSHKEHFPKPFESKFEMVSTLENTNDEALLEDQDLALTNPL